MNSAIKWVVALLVVALIAVIGLIVMSTDKEVSEPAAEAPTEPVTTTQPEETAAPEATAEPEMPGNTEAGQSGADDAAQDDAQGTMYEGALAGLTEEEIAAMAIAEEESAARTENDTGVEDAVD